MKEKYPTIIEGQIERITFRNADSHFMIAKFRPQGQPIMITVLGHIPETRPGETLRLCGEWKHHPRYGQQFEVAGFEVLLPSGVEEIRRYLSSGLIKGIGPKTAERLLAHFKGDTLSIIEKAPHRLVEVRGIGEQKAQLIGAAWQAHHHMRALMEFLLANGVKASHAARIFKTYGADALDILQHDPYRLAADIPRIGFYIADTIVRRSDLPIDDGERAQACLTFLLEEGCEEGHVFMPQKALVARCSTTFELDYHSVASALDQLVAEGRITTCPEAPEAPVYLTPLFQAEDLTARRIRAMHEIPLPPESMDSRQMLTTVVQRLAIHLSEDQVSVLEGVFHQRVLILTGGPGTGKTTLIRAIAVLFETIGRDYQLAAPTGRAARRMAEVTQRPASTLHKLLGYNLSEGRFERDPDNPLETQALIVDEASMVDAMLMGHLLKALPLTASLILVGDVFQLPSVGPGAVLSDLIKSQAVRAFELKEVFRQAAQSPIVAAAHCVRKGCLPDLVPVGPNQSLKEFTFIEQVALEAVAETIVDLCTRRIPDQLGRDGVRQVQVLSPMHKGLVGTLNLNQQLQVALNPHVTAGTALGGRFYLADKVMHLRNNYQKEVFNGEIGTIVHIDLEDRQLTVDFDGREVRYEEADLDELSLAYAISVHKSQGSEYPVIILPLVTHHYIMLQRNLLYTALTRAQQAVILVGSAKAVRIAVEADQPKQRQSLLAWRLSLNR